MTAPSVGVDTGIPDVDALKIGLDISVRVGEVDTRSLGERVEGFPGHLKLEQDLRIIRSGN